MKVNSANSQVTIIIPNLNGKKYLEFCLPSILNQTYQDFQVILVDNASTDGSVEFVKKDFPWVHLIVNDHNLGFAQANNIAIRAVSTPYVITLNNDTTVDKNWLAEIVRYADYDPGIGMIACKILYMQAPHLIDSAGLDIDQAGMAWNRYNGLEDPDEIEPYEVFCPSGAAALYKREMLDEIGLFDEAFFAYCEDMDLGWRARLTGWNCMYVPTATVYHFHSATSGQGSKFKRYMLTRNRIWTVLKNYPAPALWLHLPKLLFYDGVAALYRIMIEKNLSPLRGRLGALVQLKTMWQQRQLIQQRRSISNQQLFNQMLPPVNFIQSFKVYARKH
jgi:GT2 family glycosyltransferase